MTGTTHIITGITLWLGVSKALGLPPDMTALGCAWLGSVMPDIDEPESFIGRKLWPLSYPIKLVFKHRGAVHSLLGMVAIGALALLPRGPCLGWAAFLVGYLSHLLADTLNKSGTPLLYPFRDKVGFPPNKRYRLKTGGIGEVLFLLLALACLIALI
ncbi:MAG: metal-dependent hydrolase [Actinomycetota bacterium]|nr:metal-dependent hydrolase [Actinomycetota bacterium]